MGSTAAKGRETLAAKLLSLSGEHAMSAEAIIATLEKAPAPGASGTAPPAEQVVDPNIQMCGAPVNAHIFDPQLYAAGEAAAKWLMGKE